MIVDNPAVSNDTENLLNKVIVQCIPDKYDEEITATIKAALAEESSFFSKTYSS